MQCCTCSKWVHCRCSLLSFSRFKTLNNSLLKLSSLLLLDTPHLKIVGLPPACTPPLFNLAHLAPSANTALLSTLVFKPLILLQPTCYPSPCIQLTPLCSWLFFYISSFLFPLTGSGFFNGMPEVSNPGALNHYILSRLILLTSSVSRNLTLTHLPFSKSLASLLCDLITSTPGLAFFLPMTHTLVAASLFLSGQVYPSVNILLLSLFA